MSISAHDPRSPTGSTLYLAGQVHRPTQPGTVLIIDHDAAVRDALSQALRANGFGVDTYASAKALLNRSSIGQDSCLLIEHDLRDMTGVDLLLRLNARRIERPAIIMSARLRPLVFKNPQPAGIVAILQKPFGQDALLQCLRYALGLS